MRKLLVVGLLAVGSIAFAAKMGPLEWSDEGCSLDQTVTVTTSGIKFGSVETIDVDLSTPSALGLLAVDSSYNLYISSSLVGGGWVKVGAQ